MQGISDKVLHSVTFRYLILYLAVMTTITFFLVGYNQHSVCSTQRDNVNRTLEVYHSIEHSLQNQISLYKKIKSSGYPSKELIVKLNITIDSLQKELNQIADKKPEKVKCLIF